MLFTIWVFIKAGPTTILKAIIKNPVILFCILFSLVFAIFVGMTTLNFGTLVRYKIPCLPFYLIALILILDYKNKMVVKVKTAINNEVSIPSAILR